MHKNLQVVNQVQTLPPIVETHQVNRCLLRHLRAQCPIIIDLRGLIIYLDALAELVHHAELEECVALNLCLFSGLFDLFVDLDCVF